jgi:hypothetical protein
LKIEAEKNIDKIKNMNENEKRKTKNTEQCDKSHIMRKRNEAKKERELK